MPRCDAMANHAPLAAHANSPNIERTIAPLRYQGRRRGIHFRTDARYRARAGEPLAQIAFIPAASRGVEVRHNTRRSDQCSADKASNSQHYREAASMGDIRVRTVVTIGAGVERTRRPVAGVESCTAESQAGGPCQD